MAVRLNNSDEYEHLCNVTLTKDKFPKAFEAKVEELLEEKVCATREEAEKLIADMVIELEVYYEKGTGLFAVDSEAVSSGTIYSPYTAELCEDADDETPEDTEEEDEECWSVYVGDVEVNDYLMTRADAEELADEYREDGYDDVEVVKYDEEED